MYPEAGAVANHKTAASFAGDITFVCGTRTLLRRIRQHVDAESGSASASASQTYMYHFDVPTAGVVLHAAEIP